MSGLLGRLDRTLVGMPRAQQMVVAGEALTQLVSAFAERAELMLLDWEERYRGPLVDGAWLAGLEERPPTFNLAAYETEPVELPRPRPRNPNPQEELELIPVADSASREDRTLIKS
ncbi:hypothetical protein [Synechococcus sp. PCC 7336]|uniref:hypothetical protein n=1 Tax=Synechococcus sp. PCC 7336 TaxID=195250 RepID=UPI000347140E|nr:hypothetical protein [Synechococcus sp. PCC 7336]